ncbi:MAG TPA: rhamnulokinase family protein [Anaerolineae bacterium]|nr:rhamnulokinase family protein [Anaerolineae bacterium]
MAASTTNFLAFDLGASSGRAVVGRFDGRRLRLEEVHRFPNGPVRLLDSLYWNVLGIFEEIKTGLAKCARSYGTSIAGLGLDTWGVDYGLLDARDELLGNPYHYRDSRTDGMMEEAFRRVPREEIFERTGIQFLQLNSLYQLLAMAVQESPQLDAARTFLNMPDLFNFWLTGRKASEFTIATTSQCYDPRAGDWAWSMLEKMGLPTRIFGEVVPPGSLLGPLHPALAEETGAGPVPVIASAGHDTAAAVAAVPASSHDHVYISSGTWSILGVEVDAPLITEQSLAHNFTNEGGVENTLRLMKNIVALWIVQECRREWTLGGEEHSWDDLTGMAAEAQPLHSLVNPGDRRFLPPGDMVRKIQSFCAETAQPVPTSKGAIVRCVLESLALTYRQVLEQLETVLGREHRSIHIIGGGSRNRLLNQFTADAIGRPVVAGPSEAASIGNILMQALAVGHIGSLEEGRDLVRRSFDVTTFEPGDKAAWDDAYGRYLRLIEASHTGP